MHSVDHINASLFFQSKIEETANKKSADSLRQAYISFLNYIGRDYVEFHDFSDEKLRGWISWMFFNGYTRNTVVYYLKHLSSLYHKGVTEGLTEPTEIFSILKSELLNSNKPVNDRISDSNFFEKLQAIVRTDVSHSQSLSLGKDILLFGLYNGGLTFKEIISFKKDDYLGTKNEIIEIIEKYSRPKNKYLFPIGQSAKTPRQIEAYLSELISSILRIVALPTGNPIGETILDLWCMTAMKCGIDAATVIGCRGRRPALNPVFTYAKTKTVTDDERESISEKVVTSLTVNPIHWHAMQFRPRVSYDDVMDRINESVNLAGGFQTYYPTHEIAKRIGRKLIYENRPVIPNIMFFRSRVSDVGALFRQIGDLAWGYRREMGKSGDYAVISESDMQRYQLAIGKFSPDTQLYPLGTLEITENDTVEIIGGDFSGRYARVDHINPNQNKTIIYRLILLGDNGIEWKVNADGRLLRKIKENHFPLAVS